RAERLDLGRIGLPADWGVTGLSDATLRVSGPAGDPHWRLEAAAQGPGMNGHRADTLATVIEGRRSQLDVRQLLLGLDNGRLEGHVSFDRIASPWPDTLTAGAIRTWLLGSDRWDGEVAADSLPLDHLGRFAPAARGWGGRVDGRVTVGGSPRRPELGLAAEARSLRRDSLVVDAVSARATYRDGRLEVSELRVRRGEAAAVGSGWLPLRLDLASAPSVPDQPMSWRVELTKGDLSMLPLIAPQVAQARGRVDLSARVEGTPQKPRLEGSAQVREGVMVPAGREEVLEDVYANFRLGESRIVLDTLYAREGRRGQITGHGTIEIQGAGLKAYHLDLALREFTVHEAGFYVAQINGTAAVTDGPRIGGQIVPMITGEITLDKGVVVFDFANQAEQERLAATTQPLLWTYRIHMVALNNLRWRPPDGDIEFSADLTLEQTPGALSIWGDMHALRGTYHFLSNKFTVNKADLTFDNVGGINPVLDVEAVTRIVPTQGLPPPDVSGAVAESSLPHDVTVLITGRSDRPTIEFQTSVVGLPNSENDWDQARVLQELTVGRFIDKGGVSIGDPVDNYITRKLNEQLDPLLSKAFMGYVNQWTLAREQGGVFTGQGELLIKVSSQVNPQLLVSYSQKLPGFARPYTTTDPTSTGSLERNVEAEYRLNRFFFITTGYVQRRSLGTSLTGGTLGGEFDVNLKARWEY
ncbi:MAG TPA: translocation/assembly module TamB domain-containing protein, partial [Candidatus Eisenbacteria bacterium]